ncbi:MAG: winged helix-turn-helix domain-containing protein, partial [Candidatus Sulfotelmatobacter sp.]
MFFWPGNGSDVKIPDNEWVALVRGVMGLGGKYGFGPFEVRTGARELFENGTRVKLRGQPYLILEVLLERAGSVVTREEIRERLWPADTFVDFEHGLNTSVKKLRQVLCDSADEPRYIETVPRMGYRFIAPVEVLPGASQPAVEIAIEPATVSQPATRVADEPEPVSLTKPWSGKQWWLSVGVLVLFGAVLVGIWAKSRNEMHGLFGSSKG